MIIRVFNKLKEDKKTKQNNNEFQDSTDKTWEDTGTAK
jgi:hypothetical protein